MQVIRAYIRFLLILSPLVPATTGQPSPASNPFHGNPGGSAYVQPTAWGPETNGFRLALVPASTNFVIGHPVRVQLTLRNVSATVRSVAQTSPAWDFDFIIRDQRGELVPLTQHGKEVKDDLNMGWNNTLHVKPGEDVNTAHRIDKLYDLSRPGVYKVTAETRQPLPNAELLREQGRKEWKTLIPVLSNTVEIRVSPEPKKTKP